MSKEEAIAKITKKDLVELSILSQAEGIRLAVKHIKQIKDNVGNAPLEIVCEQLDLLAKELDKEVRK